MGASPTWDAMKKSTQIVLAGAALYVLYYVAASVVGSLAGVHTFPFLFVYFAGWFGRDLWRWVDQQHKFVQRVEDLEDYETNA